MATGWQEDGKRMAAAWFQAGKTILRVVGGLRKARQPPARATHVQGGKAGRKTCAARCGGLGASSKGKEAKAAKEARRYINTY